MARRALCCRRRPLSIRLKCLALSVFVVVVFLFSVALYSRSTSSTWTCQDGKLWSCSWTSFGARDKASPLIKTDSGRYVSSVPGENMRFLVTASAVQGAAELVTGSGWTYDKDADHLSMSSRECQSVFPGLYNEISRARSQYEKFHIIKEDLDSIKLSDGIVRLGIFGGKVSVLKTSLKSQKSRTNALAFVQSLHDAVITPGRVPIPDIEFVVNVNSQVSDLSKPVWTPNRLEADDKVWLMPDSRFVIEEVRLPKDITEKSSRLKARIWGWSGKEGEGDKESLDHGQPHNESDIIAVTRDQLVGEIETLETSLPIELKPDRLVGVWRSDDIPENARQKQLARIADGQSWAETSAQVVIAGGESDDDTHALASGGKDHNNPLSEFCRHLFLAHDGSFPISLTDGPLLCSSVIVTTRPKWIQIYHHLMLANGDNYNLGDAEHPVVGSWANQGAGTQNAVVVADDWGDLDVKMKGLRKNPDVAKTIATNNVKTFRRRYLTGAASACYWREMIHAYGSVSFEPEGWIGGDDGDPVSGKLRSRRGILWESFLFLDDESQMNFDELVLP